MFAVHGQARSCETKIELVAASIANILLSVIFTETIVRRRIIRMLLTLALVYLIVALLVMVFQRRMIYFPTKMAPELAEDVARERGFLAWRNSRDENIGWRLSAAGAATGAVLIVHGNGGCALNRNYLAGPIHAAAAVDVFVLEYPGFGARAGAPSQKSFLDAAEEAFDSIPAGRPVYIVSESLGTGVAAHLARKHGRKVAGLICFAPYDRLVSVGQAQMKIFPVSLLLWDRFEPAAWLTEYRGPVKIILAGADQVIPVRFGRKLYDGYAGPKDLEIIPDAGHNDIAQQSPEWWSKVFLFWEQKRPSD